MAPGACGCCPLGPLARAGRADLGVMAPSPGEFRQFSLCQAPMAYWLALGRALLLTRQTPLCIPSSMQLTSIACTNNDSLLD